MAAWKNTPPHEPVRGVVGRPESASHYDLRRWEPGGATGRYVEYFWSVTWDLRGREPVESTVITYPSMHLSHEWGDDGVRHGYALPGTFVHGIVEEVFRTTIRDRGSVVGARFRPGGFTARFGGDASTMTGRVCPAGEVLGRPRKFDDDIERASAELDRLIGRGDRDDTVYPPLRRLVDRIRDDDRVQRVEQVADLTPWSVRTTQRVFRRYVGVPVKWVLCRYRLQNAAWEIETDRDVDFADLAVRLGWYDQAHFINDFRTLLGETPGTYAARYGKRR
ncbi:DUF6597 domain-containing transcriptional factor [Mycolicibacterium vaccae]|uniref:DUF6597 domain-containing transcriptional factor n=1 Tax=Mycolicibacterium vaccae TaxID=1810 RepID=UPI003CFDB39C